MTYLSLANHYADFWASPAGIYSASISFGTAMSYVIYIPNVERFLVKSSIVGSLLSPLLGSICYVGIKTMVPEKSQWLIASSISILSCCMVGFKEYRYKVNIVKVVVKEQQ